MVRFSFFPTFFTLVFVLFTSCHPSHHGVDLNAWSGELVDGTSIRFDSIDAPHFVINFYSPTCQPCIEELPALEILHRELKKKGIPFYIVVEGNPESHGLPRVASKQELFRSIRERLKKDIGKYDISIPMVVLDPSIPVVGEGGIITGTPETLLLATHPITIRYNFVGPVASRSGSEEEILSDSKFEFVLQRIRSL